MGVGLLALLLAFPSSPAHSADPVIVPITVTIAESGAGAPAFSWTITGCAASPSSGTSGTAKNVSVTPNCVYTINSGGATGNGTLRDRLTSGYATSVSETSCSSGTCSPVALTAHVQELLTLSSSCNGPVVSAASPTSDSWYNYGTALTVSCNGIWARFGGTGTRAASWNWDGGTPAAVATTGAFASSLRTMNSHHALGVTIMTQYQLALDPGATRALASVTPPTITSDKYWYDAGTAVTYQGYGVFARANGFGNRSASWYLDSGVPTTLSTTSTFTISTALSSPHTVHVTTKQQWQVNLDSTSSMFLRSITTPTVASDRYWYDTGTLVTLVLNGTGSRAGGIGSRLVSYAVNGGTSTSTSTAGTVVVFNSMSITGKVFITATSAIQYQLVLDSGSISALSSVTSPSIPGDNYWYDSGTQVTYVGNGVFSRISGVGSRVASWWLDSGAHTAVLTAGTFTTTVIMSASHALHAAFLTQYEVTLVGTYGVSSATSPTISGDDYWYDAGTVVSMALQGEFGRASGTGWRMVSYSINGGPVVGTPGGAPIMVLNALTLTSPQTISVQVVKQYQVTFDSTIVTALNSITPPTIAGDNYWYDAGSPVTLTVHGVWARTPTTGYRLFSYSVNGAGATPVASSGTLTILSLSAIFVPQSITSSVTTQYLLTVNGGSGSVYSASPPIRGDTGWFDSGMTLRVSTNGTYDSSGGVRHRISAWSIDGGQSTPTGVMPTITTSLIVMNGPHTVRFDSITQYLVTVVVKDSNGVNTLAPDSILLSVNGNAQPAVSGAAWVDGTSVVSVAQIMWQGLDVAPTSSVQYGVSSPFSITVNARVYDATIVVEDPLGLAVGGADMTITLANGTTVHTSTGGDGTTILHMIPLGTYHATVSSLGLSSTVSGNASVQGTTVAHLPLSWALILLIVVIVILVVVGTLIVLRRRSVPWLRRTSSLRFHFGRAMDCLCRPAQRHF